MVEAAAWILASMLLCTPGVDEPICTKLHIKPPKIFSNKVDCETYANKAAYATIDHMKRTKDMDVNIGYSCRKAREIRAQA